MSPEPTGKGLHIEAFARLFRTGKGRIGQMAQYQVIVGNIGTVYDGTNGKDALRHYTEYVGQSNWGRGRAGGEPVVLMKNGKIDREHIGTVDADVTY